MVMVSRSPRSIEEDSRTPTSTPVHRRGREVDRPVVDIGVEVVLVAEFGRDRFETIGGLVETRSVFDELFPCHASELTNGGSTASLKSCPCVSEFPFFARQSRSTE
jgi:hypothetical protein